MKNKTTTSATLALCLCAACLFSLPLSLHGQSREQSYVDSIVSVIDSLVFNGDITQAFQQSNRICLYTAEHFGENSAQHGSVLLDNARLLLMNGSSQDALAQALKVRSIIAGTQGTSDADYAKSLHVSGVCYYNLAEFDNAEKCHKDALSIREKLFGRASAECAASLNSLGAVSLRRSDYAVAEQYLLEVKTIREKLYGSQHTEYASILSNLGLMYFYMGAYEESEKNLKEALTVRENAQGIYNPDYAGTLNNLGMVYDNLGQDKEAELCYQKGLHIREQVLGREHPAFAEGLSNLAGFLFKTGNFEKALALTLEAQSIWEKQYGKEHPEYLKSKMGIGLLKEQLGKPYEAMTDLEELVEILKKDTASNMELLLTAFSNLGQMYANGKNFQKAESIFLQCVGIFEKHPDKSLYDHAGILKKLGSLYLKKGDLAKAETYLLESKNKMVAALGEQSIEMVYLNNLLAELRFKQGRVQAALELQTASNQRVEAELKNATQFLSEHELNAYAKRFSMTQDATFTFALREKDFASLCYSHSLFYKGFVLQSAYQLRSLASKNPDTKAIAQKLTQHRRRLAGEFVKPLAERDNATIAALEDAANNFEKELARTVAGYEQAAQQCTWQQVQQALSPSEAAIEFVRFSKNLSSDADSVVYVALVVRPGKAQPVLVPLCEEKLLSDLLRKRKSRRSDYVNDLYSSESTQLYDLIWKNMEPTLQGVKTIYYSPSGLLFRLNLAAIPIPGKLVETLADQYQFVQLGSTRQLGIQAAPQALSVNSALIYGGVIYDPATDATPIDTIAAASLASRSRGELDFSATDSTLRGGSWGYLSWTEKEAEAVRSSLSTGGFKIALHSGLQATEEHFKAMSDPMKSASSPQVIHLATHGYFFPDPESAGSSQLAVRGLDEPVFKTSEQPMIRSGLVLAGGNHAWKTGKPLRPDLEDGILTAYEISQMDLSGTELVVLSACETGLGDIDGNEGVYGLQRAFKIAGAKYLVMSLWQVPDQQTQEQMAAFYDEWLVKNRSIPDAFRSAQQTVRERYEHPFFWAGFMLVE